MNKKSSHQRKRTGSSYYSDDERTSSKQIQRHQGHIKPRNDDQKKRRSRSGDKMKPNCNLPGDVDFVRWPGLLFTELSRVTPNADAFSGALR